MAQKIFVSRNGVATFNCPNCGKVKRKSVSRFMGLNQAVRLKCSCSCSHIYAVILERRQHLRKATNLTGTVTLSNKQCPVTITDLSKAGMKINIGYGKPISPGDSLDVEFILDDTKRSTIKKTVTVRSVYQPFIGVEFINQEHYGKFGAYLLYTQ